MATKTLLTLEEFERLPHDGTIHELSEGELIRVTYPKSGHNRIASRLYRKLATFLEQEALGEIFVEAAYLLAADPPTLRVPDVSFLHSSRLHGQDPDDYFRGAPELAVEIVSPSDSAEELDLKIRQYLKAGARAVWVLYPKTRSVHVFERGGASRVLSEGDRLEAPELFPGWSVPVAELFAL